MINKVFNILEKLELPLMWNDTPPFDDKGIVIDYHFFGEEDCLFGDGIALDVSGKLQVDIYSKADYSVPVNQVKTLLRDAGFLFEDGSDNTENLDNYTKLYHKVLIFNYSESEVMKSWEKQ